MEAELDRIKKDWREQAKRYRELGDVDKNLKRSDFAEFHAGKMVRSDRAAVESFLKSKKIALVKATNHDESLRQTLKTHIFRLIRDAE
ncbi:MAG TPA: hypothetical protein VGQ00_03730 [Candidatus Norongarragalinales archaeon]|jgi:hypothetical protein|nr:hypothetical protein [Candidatus Norongarragalinales archaeon]